MNYEDEKAELMKNQKKDIVKRLDGISTEIKNDKYKSIKDFLISSSTRDFQPIIPEINSLKNRILIWFNIKIIGIIFMISYLTGVFVFIGLIDSIKEEIKYSTYKYLFNETRTLNETFYENYNTINLKSPSFELYFLSSIITNCSFSYCGIYVLTTIVLILNFLTVFLGLNNFEFHISQEDINENYTIKQYLFLIMIFVLCYCFIGLVASLPHSIFESSFFQYEVWKEEYINKNKKNKIKEEPPLIENNNENKDLSKVKKKGDGEYNGYILGYYLSILISMALKIVINKYIICVNCSNEYNSDIFIIIIACYSIPIILSLIFYLIFSCIFDSEIKKEKKPKEISNCRICGYFYYSESEDNPIDIQCEGCRTGFRKCYYNCYCDKVSKCPCCKCLNCFECSICCGCLSCCCYCCRNIQKCQEWFKCCFQEANLTQIDNRNNKVCILYKTSGICLWLCNLLTNREVIAMALILYCLELFNFGFRPSLENYINNCDKSIIDFINLFSLSGILLGYFLAFIFGLFVKCCIGGKLGIKGEGAYLGIGIIFQIPIGALVSFIISMIVHFDIVEENIKYYIIPLSIGCIEYYKILAQTISIALLKLEVVSFNFVFSIYILIWTCFSLILEILDANINNLIFAQFIITSIIIGISLIIFSLLIVGRCRQKKIENLQKKIEELEKQKQNNNNIENENDNEIKYNLIENNQKEENKENNQDEENEENKENNQDKENKENKENNQDEENNN